MILLFDEITVYLLGGGYGGGGGGHSGGGGGGGGGRYPNCKCDYLFNRGN
jgi:hypothetical protein